MFVDRTGRRRRLAVLAGSGLGAGLLVSLGAIALGLFAGGSVPVPGWPDPQDGTGRERAGVGQLVDAPGPGTIPTGQGGPAEGPARPPAETPRTTPAPSASTTRANPGDPHRNPSPGKPGGPDRTGRPDRSAGTPG
ncbi:hypothetical protein [Plantactinospora sp. B5E13]|uniref:hypothetical protein n=1 Tax=Plantactinospora sp. B5E13 TaxID=3153758 RepID=UPI00325C65C7